MSIDNRKKFYESFGLLQTSKDRPKKELLIKLLEKPKKEKEKDTPHHSLVCENIQQADLLFLPNDKGFKYALVVVRTDTKKCDAEPLKDKEHSSILKAFKHIYKRELIPFPARIMRVDNGSEWGASIKDYFKEHNVELVKSMTARHRQTSQVEAINRIIGKVLNMRMTAQELRTNKTSVSWKSYLPKVIKAINDQYSLHKKYKNINQLTNDTIPPPRYNKTNRIVLNEGQKVRIALDYPQDIQGKRLHSQWREGDIRWDRTIRTITKVILTRAQPPMYQVSGINNAWFVRQKLQLVEENEQLPPEDVMEKEVEKIIRKRRNVESGLVEFFVKYIDGKTEYIERKQLIKDYPDIVKAFELTKRLKSK